MKQLLTEKVPRIRYQLWNGKREAALERIQAVDCATKRLEGPGTSDDAERVRRFRQHLIDLRDYLRSNWNGLRNYASETGQGRKVSSAMAESAMGGFAGTGFGCGRHCPGCVPGVEATTAVAPSGERLWDPAACRRSGWSGRIRTT